MQTLAEVVEELKRAIELGESGYYGTLPKEFLTLLKTKTADVAALVEAQNQVGRAAIEGALELAAELHVNNGYGVYRLRSIVRAEKQGELVISFLVRARSVENVLSKTDLALYVASVVLDDVTNWVGDGDFDVEFVRPFGLKDARSFQKTNVLFENAYARVR